MRENRPIFKGVSASNKTLCGVFSELAIFRKKTHGENPRRIYQIPVFSGDFGRTYHARECCSRSRKPSRILLQKIMAHVQNR